METTNPVKRNRGDTVMPSSPDILSSLSDDVLLHILSFLPTKHSVATSALAKRWRHLWTEVPDLYFDDDLYPVKGLYSRTNCLSGFAGVISHVMLLQVGRINTFRLSSRGRRHPYWEDCCFFYLDKWIQNAVARGVQAFDLDIDNLVTLPSSLFTCKTLVELMLHYRIGVTLDQTVCLPSLKTLHLLDMKGNDDRALPHLLSGCPVLTELIIERMDYEDMLNLKTISSPTIEYLWLDIRLAKYKSFDGVLELNIPALRYLILRDSNKHSFKMAIDVQYPCKYPMYSFTSLRTISRFARGSVTDLRLIDLSSSEMLVEL